VTLYFVSGAKVEATELRDHIEMKGQQIAINEEKLRLIENFRKINRKRREKD